MISDKIFKKEDMIHVLMIVISALLYSLGMSVFVKSGNLFPGGYAGISRLISEVLRKFFNISLSFSVIYFLMNGLTTIFVWKKIGHKFVIYSVMWYTLTSFLTSFNFQEIITNDPLLIAVFGGLINGLAVGIALRNNASSGGTDFIAIYMSIRFNMPTWNYVMAANACVLMIAGLLFGWEQALYSIIFQYVSTQVVGVIHQRYKLTGLNVVTNYPQEVCDAVFHTCRHGITKVQCEGGFTDEPHWLLMMTINTYQMKDVIDNIKHTDPHAFITVNSVNRIVGNYYQKPLE
ncbi:MAG: YitT family protein [Solobacterium sp.]|nr:YitT family protein [Solobacterium sp.]